MNTMNNQISFYLNVDEDHTKICNFCKKPFGKYTVENEETGKSFYCCNRCLINFVFPKNKNTKPIALTIPSTFPSEKGYIVSAFEKTEEGSRQVYLAIDSYSGGYPYWAIYLHSAEVFNTIEESKGDTNYAVKHYNVIPDTVTIYEQTVTYNRVSLENHI